MLVGATQPNSTVRDGLLVSPAVVDLGDVEQGKTKEVVFTLKNVSDQPIEQIELVSGCGCTIMKTVKSTLDPGESTQALGEFTTVRRRGPNSVSLLLEYVALGAEKQRILTVTADVTPFVVFKPTTVRFALDDESDGSHSSGLVTFTSAKHGGFQLEEVSCRHPAISVRELEGPGSGSTEDRDHAPRSITVEVTLDHEKWKSSRREAKKRVVLSVLTNIETEPRLTIPIIVN